MPRLVRLHNLPYLPHPLRDGYNAPMSDSPRRRANRTFDPRRYARSQEVQLVAGFFVLLYLVGGALIWWFYGGPAAVLGITCITGGLIFFLLIYLLFSLIGWWANRTLDE